MTALVIGGSIAVSMVAAVLIGLSVPAILHRLKLDPKIAAVRPVSLAMADILHVVDLPKCGFHGPFNKRNYDLRRSSIRSKSWPRRMGNK